MTRKFSVKDLAYFLSWIIIGLLIAIAGLVFIFGTDIKGIQNDSQRLNDLNEIRSQIKYYISTNRKFPDSIQELEKKNPSSRDYDSSPNGSKSIYRDPKTKEFYELKYNSNNKNFKLCANFETDSSKLGYSSHAFKKGYNCLDYDIDSYYQSILTGKDTNTYPKY